MKKSFGGKRLVYNGLNKDIEITTWSCQEKMEKAYTKKNPQGRWHIDIF